MAAAAPIDTPATVGPTAAIPDGSAMALPGET